MSKYLVMWGSEGLEALVDITQYENFERKNVFNILADKPQENNPLGAILFSLKMRTQANAHRHCELYAFTSQDLEKQDIETWFKKSPQTIVDSIRDCGIKLMSYKADSKPKII